MHRYDVAIVGGGLVGASLAFALSPLGLDVALIEAVEFRAESQPSYDDRTLALSASSCAILESLDLWSDLRENATAISEIHVRELDRPGVVVMNPAELGLDRFGHVVEARVFGQAVLQKVPGLSGIDYLCPARVSGLEHTPDGVVIHTGENGSESSLEASLLVGADGANSFIREQLGIEAEYHDYGQTAVICNITPEEQHRGRAYELFTPTGPFAVMPHVNGRCGLIWCETPDRAEKLLEIDESEFLALAQERFGMHLGQFTRIGRRSRYPLRLVRALSDTAKRSVILGNAAHAIHPIGAQGFNLGLRDAAVLAEVVADALRQNGREHIGDAAVLQRYSSWRKQDQEGTVAYSDGMARLFSNPSRLAASVRTLGMVAHAWVPALRRQLAIKAMGYRGRTPKLALGESL